MFSPCQNGEEVDEREQVRQEIGRLVQQIDAQLVVGDADMDMHPADRETPADALQIALQALVADALGRLLRLPAGEGMRRRGDRGDAVSRRDRCDRAAQPPQIGPRLVEARADPRPDLDLRAQELGAHLRAEQRLAFGQHAVGRVADDVARRPVDEKIFLLDAEGEFGLAATVTARRGSSRSPSAGRGAASARSRPGGRNRRKCG